MYLTLLALPLATFCSIGLFGRSIGPRGTILLSVFSAATSALISFFIFYEVALCGTPCMITIGDYFTSSLFDASWGLLFDTLTAVMCVVVTFISFLVILYSCSYMIEDPHFIRFISYLKLFTVAMLTLVTADNYMVLFVGWELVGLASFLLISFWFTRLQAGKAAIQAMLYNRVGDVGLALGIVCLFFCYKTTNYHALFCSHYAGNTLDQQQLLTLFGISMLDVSCILLFIGAMGKSGQFILHAWLPNAMNAPTPVSALLHAATMVKISCHLIMRIINENFAICWKRHKINEFVTTGLTHYESCKKISCIRAYQQEMLLQKCNNSSSETARKTTFNFDCYNMIKPSQKPVVDTNFLIWFIGFVEGDGSFIVSHNKVYFDLTQNIKEMSLLYKIKKHLGFGSVLIRKNPRNVGVFYVTGETNFLRLVNLFNGHIHTGNKQRQFKKWLNTFNKQYGYHIRYKNCSLVPDFHNAWFSGFIDAEGRFIARVKKCHSCKLKKNLCVEFEIGQKQKDILELIRPVFGIATETNIRYDRSWNGYVFFCSAKSQLIPLLRYLNKNPLKTYKKNVFSLWFQIHSYGQQKKHLSPSGMQKVEQLCNQIKRLHSRKSVSKDNGYDKITV